MIIAANVRRFGHVINTDEVLGTHNRSAERAALNKLDLWVRALIHPLRGHSLGWRREEAIGVHGRRIGAH